MTLDAFNLVSNNEVGTTPEHFNDGISAFPIAANDWISHDFQPPASDSSGYKDDFLLRYASTGPGGDSIRLDLSPGGWSQTLTAPNTGHAHQYEILEYGTVVLTPGITYTLKATFLGGGFSYDCVTVKSQGVPQ